VTKINRVNYNRIGLSLKVLSSTDWNWRLGDRVD